MSNRKRFTNVNFTKRVDHEAGRHRPPRAMSEPSVCRECAAVYVNRRWERAGFGPDVAQYAPRSTKFILCPACAQIRNGTPRGFVYIDGPFFISHQEEVEQLLRNEAARAEVDNPLARIMGMRGADHKLTVSTTTEHLAQRLGHALEKAFGGQTHYDFSHENKLARVKWQR